MTQKHYRNAAGQYLGSFDDGRTGESHPFDPGAVECPSAPLNGRATWNGTGWDEPAPAPTLLLKTTIIDRLTPTERRTAHTALDVLRANGEAGDDTKLHHFMLWQQAVEIAPDDARVTAFFELLFGATRTAELLAPV